MTTKCDRDHEALKSDPDQFLMLKHVGFQPDTLEDGTEVLWDLRDCTCGSTLSALSPVSRAADVCEACGGSGETFEDHFDHRTGHYTTQQPCPDCKGERT